MTDRQIFLYTIIASSAIHIAALGSMGGFFNLQANPLPKTQAIELKQKNAPLLPEIKMIGEFKQFTKTANQNTQVSNSQKNAFTQAVDNIEPESMQTDDIAQKAMLRYQDTVKQKIESTRHYPLRAQRMRLEGVVDIAFVINKDGTSRNVRVIRASGSKLLDMQALENIRKASPFMPLPQEISRSFVDIRVAIVFSLDNV